jgi:hypothetical protein
MRLSRLVLICALGLTSLSPGVSAGPVDEQRLAFADWKGKQFDRNHWEWVGAFVYEESGPTGSRIFGGVFKGRCTRKPGHGVSCSASGNGMSPRDTFTMGPAASDATLDVKHKRFNQHVEWAATDEVPSFFQSESGCPAGSGYGGGIVREATSTGDVFGRHFESKSGGFGWNMLWSGAHVTQCMPFSARDINDLLDGGPFTLRLHR